MLLKVRGRLNNILNNNKIKQTGNTKTSIMNGAGGL